MNTTSILVLSGPPKAGKSRLRGDIYRALVARREKSWFVQAFSPDCEGQWVNDAHARGRGGEAESLARRAKTAVRAAGEFFSPRFVDAMTSQMRGLCRAFRLVVADLGGIPSRENAAIVDAAEGRVVPVVLLGSEGGDGGWTSWWRQRGAEPLVVRYHEGLAGEVLAATID